MVLLPAVVLESLKLRHFTPHLPTSIKVIPNHQYLCWPYEKARQKYVYKNSFVTTNAIYYFFQTNFQKWEWVNKMSKMYIIKYTAKIFLFPTLQINCSVKFLKDTLLITLPEFRRWVYPRNRNYGTGVYSGVCGGVGDRTTIYGWAPKLNTHTHTLSLPKWNPSKSSVYN